MNGWVRPMLVLNAIRERLAVMSSRMMPPNDSKFHEIRGDSETSIFIIGV